MKWCGLCIQAFLDSNAFIKSWKLEDASSSTAVAIEKGVGPAAESKGKILANMITKRKGGMAFNSMQVHSIT